MPLPAIVAAIPAVTSLAAQLASWIGGSAAKKREEERKKRQEALDRARMLSENYRETGYTPGRR